MASAGPGSPEIHSSILWGDNSELHLAAGASQTIDESIVQGGCTPGCSGVLDADPKLGTLGDYGGNTPTIPLNLGSAAIDAATKGDCLSFDQRAKHRPAGVSCDLGAYEVQAASFVSIGSQDGWVLESAETSGSGGSLNSGGASVLVGDDASNRQYRAILSFNTSRLGNVTGEIMMAKLKLNVRSLTASDFSDHGKLVVDLNKGAFGLPGLELTDFQAPATLPGAARVDSHELNFAPPIVLNSTAANHLNRSGLSQLRLRFALDDDNDLHADIIGYYSGNAGPLSRPVLWVYYNP